MYKTVLQRIMKIGRIQGVPEKILVIVEKLSYLDKEKLRKTGSKLLT